MVTHFQLAIPFLNAAVGDEPGNDPVDTGLHVLTCSRKSKETTYLNPQVRAVDTMALGQNLKHCFRDFRPAAVRSDSVATNCCDFSGVNRWSLACLTVGEALHGRSGGPSPATRLRSAPPGVSHRRTIIETGNAIGDRSRWSLQPPTTLTTNIWALESCLVHADDESADRR